MHRDFKGVWIPKEIWLDEVLGWSEKLLLVEIDSLAKNGECFASNEHFSKFLKLSKKRVSELITYLHREGYITVELVYKKDTKEIDKRIIRPIPENRYTPAGESVDPMPEKEHTPIPESQHTPIPENRVDSNTSFITNTSLTNTSTNTTYKETKDMCVLPSLKKLNEEFETLWKLYPRKKGKKNAKQTYINARKKGKVTYETVENGLKQYIEYIKFHDTEDQYIKHGATWFNQECWNDEYTFNKKMQLSPFTQYMLSEIENPDDFFEEIGVKNYEPRGNRKIIFSD